MTPVETVDSQIAAACDRRDRVVVALDMGAAIRETRAINHLLDLRLTMPHQSGTLTAVEQFGSSPAS